MKSSILSMVGLSIAIGSIGIGSVSADSVTPQTSIADFNVIAKDPVDPDPDNGALVLKTVPNFSYGSIKASEIYAGFNNKTAKTAGNLEVSDTRLGISDWTVTASMSEFADGANKLIGSTLSLASVGSLGEELSANISDDESSTDIVKGNGKHGVDTFVLDTSDSKLSMGGNPNASLAKDEAFKTTINWNLSSTTPVAPEA